jgi:hypothetical protein
VTVSSFAQSGVGSDNPALRDAMGSAGVDMASFQLEVLEDLGGGEV